MTVRVTYLRGTAAARAPHPHTKHGRLMALMLRPDGASAADVAAITGDAYAGVWLDASTWARYGYVVQRNADGRYKLVAVSK